MLEVLIPYQQGGLFRPYKFAGTLNLTVVLIPYQQGGLFRLWTSSCYIIHGGVLIPYQQGGLFRLIMQLLKVTVKVLIPYQQGGLFRHWYKTDINQYVIGLNPLSAGRSFQTLQNTRDT